MNHFTICTLKASTQTSFTNYRPTATIQTICPTQNSLIWQYVYSGYTALARFNNQCSYFSDTTAGQLKKPLLSSYSRATLKDSKSHRKRTKIIDRVTCPDIFTVRHDMANRGKRCRLVKTLSKVAGHPILWVGNSDRLDLNQLRINLIDFQADHSHKTREFCFRMGYIKNKK